MVVGTILFAVNQLDVVLRGGGGLLVCAKVAITYVVLFVVSNLSLLVATRRAAS